MPDILNVFLHLDEALGAVIAQYGGWTYGLLALIVFCETGLVVTPFLPGDSLLFAAGAFAGAGALNIGIVLPLLFAAAVIGDAVNYNFGARIGRRALERGRLFGLPIRKEHLEKTARFYERYGAKTIVIARFVPIVRTLAPFVAGVGGMRYRTFVAYNLAGAVLWIGLFCLGGYFFGNIPAVSRNFEIVILAIIGVSVLPIVVEYIKERARRKDSAPKE